MIFIFAEKLHFVLYLSVGLLGLLILTECEQIRLVGPSRCSGRVEVFHMNSWGTVCNKKWNMSNAVVACRELNCGTALEAETNGVFGNGNGTIWLDGVQCAGHESSIFRCQHKPLGDHDCRRRDDAAIVCSDHVRIINGSDRCQGRVELYHNNQWNRVCDSGWGKEEADVACRMINCGSSEVHSEVVDFGEAHGLSGVKANCSGNEESLAECSLQEFQEDCADATVVCSNTKSIRLVSGNNRCSGRLEIYHAGEWGAVCGDGWGIDDLTVACRQLNCGNALLGKSNNIFGRGSGHIWITFIDCTGHETTLSDCPHRGFGSHHCLHNDDVSVLCSESVRLTGGADRCSGRLEVFHGGTWGKVCNNNWGPYEEKMACQELHCGDPKTKQKEFTHSENSGQRSYLSNCSVNVTSITNCTFQESSERCEDVSLSCTGIQIIRLVNGTDRCSGRVEIYPSEEEGTIKIHNLWKTVPDDAWTIKDAMVVCRAMDCGTALTAKSGALFGEHRRPLWFNKVMCFGNESSLFRCPYSTLRMRDLIRLKDSNVVCSTSIRLVNGADRCSGKVEVYHDDQWLPALNLNWGMNETTVVCRAIKCGDPVQFSGSQSGSEVSGYKVSCRGTESSLTECTLTEHVRTSSDNIGDASVVCSDSVRLADGVNRCVGRVESFENGQWGTVCGESWDMNDAAVVCRQLDCGRAHTITTTPKYGYGTGPVWIDQTECNGPELTLSECQQRPFRDRTCNISSVAGVTCKDGLTVRLVNGKDRCSGRVEVSSGGVWATVCDTHWTMAKANAVCELLKCGYAVGAPGGAHFLQGTGAVKEATDSCFTNVTSLEQCSAEGFSTSTCGHERDAGVVCGAPIRLVDGTKECSGRVEIFHEDQWGTVCDNGWDMVDATVVCRQLGCGPAISAPTLSYFGEGSNVIWLDDVRCRGEEPALSQCQHSGYGRNHCGHEEDAGVICFGRLHKPQITLRPASEVKWGGRVEFTCTVETVQSDGTFVLGKRQDSFQLEKAAENGAATFLFSKVDFSHAGSYFCEYKTLINNQLVHHPQGDIIQLSVNGPLDRPSISLTSPHAVKMNRPDRTSVNKGDSLSITCSINSIYPGGYFYLTRSNISATDSKLAFGHGIRYMSTFELPSLGLEHQGEYSCVYGVNLSSNAFTSVSSTTIQVTVVDTMSSLAVSAVVVAIVVLILLMVIGYVVWRKRRRRTVAIVKFNKRSEEE